MRHLKSPISTLALMAASLLFGCSSDDDPTLALSSPSIQTGKPLPDQFACDGKDFGEGTSPELNWSHEPSGTKSYAVLLKDLTIEAGESGDMDPEHPFHWTIWNIPSSTHQLSASLSTDQSPLTGTVAQQQNGAPPFIKPGPYGYFGPCPNFGVAAFGAPAEVHNYQFILYTFSDAVLTPPAYDPGPNADMPLNPVRQLANFFEAHPSLLDTTELGFTSDATPTACPGFPSPMFACAPASP
jgi:phosphatidylethanolamine-binding protein (PEBP) family uncharacterized protein